MMHDEPHTIEAALRRGELTEDEAYFVLRFAGRVGYSKAIKRLKGPLKAARRWLVWAGGWEHPELGQWDRGEPPWEFFTRGRLNSPTPLSFFGHRITINGCGENRWIDLRIGGGYMHARLDGSAVYWSPDATPQHPEAIHFVGRRPHLN